MRKVLKGRIGLDQVYVITMGSPPGRAYNFTNVRQQFRSDQEALLRGSDRKTEFFFLNG